MTPVLLLGGIVSGIFTPTESALIAVGYSFIISFFYYKDLAFKDIPNICEETFIITGVVLGMLSVASLFVRIMAIEGIASKIQNISYINNLSPNIFLFFLIIFFLLLGCFLQVTPSIILFGPILLPLAIKMGIDPIHFGLLMIMSMIMGTVTPPVAASLYAVADIAKLPPYQVFKASIPFLLVILVVLYLVAYAPFLALFLPNIVFGD